MSAIDYGCKLTIGQVIMTDSEHFEVTLLYDGRTWCFAGVNAALGQWLGAHVGKAVTMKATFDDGAVK